MGDVAWCTGRAPVPLVRTRRPSAVAVQQSFIEAAYEDPTRLWTRVASQGDNKCGATSPSR